MARLAAIGDLHALWCFGGGLVVFLWSLHVAGIEALPRLWRRLATFAAGAMLLAVAQRFGRELLEVQEIPRWVWWAGLVVLPVLMAGAEGAKAFALLIWLVCVGVAMEMAGDWIADGSAINGAIILLASAAWVLAVIAQVFRPRVAPPAPPAPPPAQDEQALSRQLDSAEAQEAADKYTRE